MISDSVVLNDWHVVASSKEIIEGEHTAVRLLEENLVVWRTSGKVSVFLDQCPHRGASLSLGEIRDGDKLMCPYHGWQFNGLGKCECQPAQPDLTPPEKAAVRSFDVREKYGLVWVCLGEADKDVPELVGCDDDYELVVTGPYDVDTSAPRAIENFLDMAHFPFVHTNYLGVEPYTKVKDYDVETTDNGIVAKNCRAYQPQASSIHKEPSEVAYTYRVLRPYTVMLTKEPGAAGEKPSDIIMLTIAPKDELEIRAWIVLAMTYAKGEPESSFRDFQDMIFGQDKSVLESERPKRLPLDLTAEVHQKADQSSIAYRKWLKKINLTYGTTLELK
jgi:phenylpropionate dioxygenase-like ring-hydroxylating dioxygenase large terminal subunit